MMRCLPRRQNKLDLLLRNLYFLHLLTSSSPFLFPLTLTLGCIDCLLKYMNWINSNFIGIDVVEKKWERFIPMALSSTLKEYKEVV